MASYVTARDGHSGRRCTPKGEAGAGRGRLIPVGRQFHRRICGMTARAFPIADRRTVGWRGAPSLGDFCAPVAEREHDVSFTHPSRGRRALILASTATLALSVVATTVASAEAKPGGKGPHARSAATPDVTHTSDDFGTPLMKKQDALRAGRSPAARRGQAVRPEAGRQAGQGSVRRPRQRGHRQDLRGARRVRRQPVPEIRRLPGSAAGRQHHGRHRPAATTRSPSRTAPSTTAPCGRRTTTATTTRTCTSTG